MQLLFKSEINFQPYMGLKRVEVVPRRLVLELVIQLLFPHHGTALKVYTLSGG